MKNQGFSLIEVIVFVVILSFVFITSVMYITNLLRIMKVNEHKVLATHYAEEVLEWLQSEREDDWNALLTKSSTGTVSQVTYCMNGNLELDSVVADLGTTEFPSAPCTNFNGIGTTSPRIFQREMTLKKKSDTQIDASIRVRWLEDSSTNEFEVPLDTTFSVWE